ncbi:proline-rich receptor-like protein kinase PERK8 [Iris pallida]|uniref:Proline-rich receptor-like protein kinase PERK8 n=1 Tax=Iris pallida TaxID=29817 RepID=A0AAX6GDN6_IRIPA|nr:proline-rich receptor-like protein kinase PERK8 [Iris pallida]
MVGLGASDEGRRSLGYGGRRRRGSAEACGREAKLTEVARTAQAYGGCTCGCGR